MILAIDVGNTNIVVGCIDDLKTYFIERLSTNRTKTELEYAGSQFTFSYYHCNIVHKRQRIRRIYYIII